MAATGDCLSSMTWSLTCTLRLGWVSCIFADFCITPKISHCILAANLQFIPILNLNAHQTTTSQATNSFLTGIFP